MTMMRDIDHLLGNLSLILSLAHSIHPDRQLKDACDSIISISKSLKQPIAQVASMHLHSTLKEVSLKRPSIDTSSFDLATSSVLISLSYCLEQSSLLLSIAELLPFALTNKSQHGVVLCILANYETMALPSPVVHPTSRKRKHSTEPSSIVKLSVSSQGLEAESLVRWIRDAISKATGNQQLTMQELTTLCICIEMYLASPATNGDLADLCHKSIALLRGAVGRRGASKEELWTALLCIARVSARQDAASLTLLRDLLDDCIDLAMPYAEDAAGIDQHDQLDLSAWVLAGNASSIVHFLLAVPSLSDKPSSPTPRTFKVLDRVWRHLQTPARLACFRFAVSHSRALVASKPFKYGAVSHLLHFACSFLSSDGPSYIAMIELLSSAIRHWIDAATSTLDTASVSSIQTKSQVVAELFQTEFCAVECQLLFRVLKLKLLVEFQSWSHANSLPITGALPFDSAQQLSACIAHFCQLLTPTLATMLTSCNCAYFDFIITWRCFLVTLRLLDSSSRDVVHGICQQWDATILAHIQALPSSLPFECSVKLSTVLAALIVDAVYSTNMQVLDTERHPCLRDIYAYYRQLKAGLPGSQSMSQSQTCSEPALTSINIIISAFSKALNIMRYTHPQVALCLLAEIASLFAQLDSNSPLLYHCYEELHAGARAFPGGTLALLLYNPADTVTRLFLPVFRHSVNKGIEQFVKLVRLLCSDKDLELFAEAFGLLFTTKLILSRDEACKTNLKRLRNCVKGPLKFVFYNAANLSALDENAQLLYDCLDSVDLRDLSEMELIRDKLLHYLHELSAAFGAPALSSITEATMQKLLTLIVRDIGSSDEHLRSVGMRALRVYSYLFKKRLLSMQARSQEDLDSAVADNLSQHFLYLMSSVIQKDWRELPACKQENNIGGLQAVITLIRRGDIAKFLPKILFFIDTAFSSSSMKVQARIVGVVEELFLILPADALRENLQALLVSLYSLIECTSRRIPATLSNDNVAYLDSFGRAGVLFCPFGASSSSHILNIIFESASHADIELSCLRSAQAKAVGLVRSLFLERINDIRDCIAKVPYIPDVEALKSIREIHSDELRALSFDQRLKGYCEALTHESVQVRLAALRQIRESCQHNKHEFYTALALKESSIGSTSSVDLVSLLVQSLLVSLAKESSLAVKEQCALCLGSLGAIDPARVNVILGHQDQDEVLPWRRDAADFCLGLLRDHLIPALKAATGGGLTSVQDRIGVAIQECLPLLAAHLDPPAADGVSSEPMRRLLRDNNIFEICEPFFCSRYSLPRDTDEINYAVDDLDFERWLSLWCRHLIKQVAGPLKLVFEACRGALRSRVALGQYLLPHLIVNVLLSPANNQECNKIVAEISRNLRFSAENADSSEGNLMRVQALFSLMDTLENWFINTISWQNRRDASATDRVKAIEFCNSVRGLLGSIPKSTLGDAALRINSFARALRYFEQDAREKCEAEGSLGARSRNDGSNGTLPPLSVSLLDRLIQIYSSLGSNDAVQGVQFLRAVNGYPSSAWNKILELESSGQWQAALLEYSFVRSSALVSVAEVNSSYDSRRSTEASAEECKLECGRMRCLIEMGQIDAVVPQVRALTSSRASDAVLEVRLLPLAIEASWQLQSWDQLDSSLSRFNQLRAEPVGLDITPEDSFQVHIGSLLGAVRSRDKSSLIKCLEEARKEVVPLLAAASMESYSRSYPFLTQLHVLDDIETGFTLVHGDANCFMDLHSKFHWGDRSRMMASAMQARSAPTAVKRVLLSMCNNSDAKALLTQSWLQECRLRSGQVDAARFALRNAHMQGLDEESLLKEECGILKNSGLSYKALTLLEPIEFDVTKTDQYKSADVKKNVAEKLLLATQLMAETSQRHGRSIVDRFRAVEKLCPSEDAYYLHASYVEGLYHDTKAKEDLSKNVMSTQCQNYIHEAILLYCKCLKGGNKHIMKALPKLLTLWFSITELRDGIRSQQQTGQAKSTLETCIDNVNKCIEGFVQSKYFTSGLWYVCISQLISRTGHDNKHTVAIILKILTRLVALFPQQSIWHLAGMLHSKTHQRKAAGNSIVKEAVTALLDNSRRAEADMLLSSTNLFASLIQLTQHDAGKDVRQLRWEFKKLKSSHFLVPSQSALIMHIPSSSTELNNTSAYFAEGNECIVGFDSTVEILHSKEKPKTIRLITTSGLHKKFLLKHEHEGDLRKDSRIMEINHFVNRLFMEDPEGISRALRLRTYCVSCLDENCAMLEWVDNTRALRLCIADAHTMASTKGFNFTSTEFRKAYDEMQKIPVPEERISTYRALVLDQYKPCFHRWFLSKFLDATKWLEAREAFTRSAAVWSVVGHIVGLGDRHSENILIDVANGECVFVDFDCLFEKGLQLSVPEIVPFRLTPNMVDAMGITGVEGMYRRSMEVTLNVLRQNKDSLLSILEPFLNDPTVEWARKGKAQKTNEAFPVKMPKGKDNMVDVPQTLNKIGDRLKGIYNISHPKAAEIIKILKESNIAPPLKGLGALPGDEFLLSVQGQAQRLIEEAIAEENLSQMYVGWQPWL